MTPPWPETVEMGTARAAPAHAAPGSTSRGEASSAPDDGGADVDASVGADPNEGTPSARSSTPASRAATRGEVVALAIQIDAMIARSKELGLGMTTYLLGIARADLGERLGERRNPAGERDPASEREPAGEREPVARAANED